MVWALWDLEDIIYTDQVLQNILLTDASFPIHLHLQKISGRQHLRAASLPSNHALHSLLENQHSKNTKSHRLSLDNLTFKQCLKIKSAVVNSNNRLNGIFPSFETSHKELSSDFIW